MEVNILTTPKNKPILHYFLPYFRVIINRNLKKMATKKTNAVKKELAKEFYTRSNLTLNEIAAQCKISPNTLSAWIKQGAWDILKDLAEVGHDKIVADLMSEIQEINEFVKTRPVGQRFADKNIADARNKIISGIQSMQKNLTIGQYVSVMLDFIQFTAMQDIDLSQVKDIATAFLHQKAENN